MKLQCQAPVGSKEDAVDGYECQQCGNCSHKGWNKARRDPVEQCDKG